MPLRNKEHSYRSLLIELNVAMLRALSAEGLALMEKISEETDAEKRHELVHGNDGAARIAMDCADIVGTIEWLQQLPAELCPNVQAADTLSRDALFAKLESTSVLEELERFAERKP